MGSNFKTSNFGKLQCTGAVDKEQVTRAKIRPDG